MLFSFPALNTETNKGSVTGRITGIPPFSPCKKITKMTNEIVKIRWIDAQRLELGIIQKNEFSEIEPLPCEIIGFKIFENKKWITIAQEKWDEPSGGAKYVHIIPKVSILKITKLKEI